MEVECLRQYECPRTLCGILRARSYSRMFEMSCGRVLHEHYGFVSRLLMPFDFMTLISGCSSLPATFFQLEWVSFTIFFCLKVKDKRFPLVTWKQFMIKHIVGRRIKRLTGSYIIFLGSN